MKAKFTYEESASGFNVGIGHGSPGRQQALFDIAPMISMDSATTKGRDNSDETSYRRDDFDDNLGWSLGLRQQNHALECVESLAQLGDFIRGS